ncbi:MAG: phosphodiester glycosidase family protein [Clostridia bacterium]|nr:phosphodiester glycosidase family protein [Clostridia bacterium]
MKYIRKSISIILISVLVLVSTFCTVYAESGAIYQYSEGTTPVTSGATLEKITRLTDEGWLDINVLRVDISNPDVKIDTIVNTDSIRSTSTTKSFAQGSGAVAAVNSSYFIWTDTPGVVTPIGPVLKDNKVLSADSEFNKNKNPDKFASLSISNLNEVLCSYIKLNISLTAPNGNTLEVGRYNTPYSGHRDLTIHDRKWSKKSIGTDTPRVGCSDILEMVVVDGIVTEIRQGQPAVEIPENGYVVITRKGGDQLILDNFAVGDPVQYNVTGTPDFSSQKAIINGGAIILKDGKIPDAFSHIPEGTYSSNKPRTAIGSSKDGKRIFMVTVDGKPTRSVGVTLTELAQIMAELGAYNAINLDGGGSSAMVSRTPGTNDITLINDPSDGSMRKVSAAVGIFSTGKPTNELSGLFIDTDDDNVFINTSRAFTVRGYDKYYNPIPIKPKDVKWSVSGLKGYFKDNVFYPKSLGRGKIKATVGKISKEIEISSLSSPVQLKLSQSTLKLPLGKSRSFTVRGKNKNGYYANIYPTDIKWTVKGGIGRFGKDEFTATKEGVGYLDAAVGNTHAYCVVSVEVEKTTVIDKFEDNNNTFVSYPATVAGSYETSKEQKHSGNTSGKLTYDFSNIEGNRAAYVVLENDGIPLAANSKKLGMWVYNDHDNPSWLAAWVNDSKGKQHQVYFTKNIDWTGWKYVEASLENIDSPAKVTRVYLVQPNPVADSGSIFIDDLSVTSSSYPSADKLKVPKDTVPVDEANKSTSFKRSSTSFRFAVFGQSREPKNALEKLLVTNLTKKINTAYDAAAFVGDSGHEGAKAVKKPLVATDKGYKSLDISNSKLIQLDTSNGGLHKTDPEQWRWLLKELDSVKGNNIFIFMADSPQSFDDKLEAELFQKVLTDYKKKAGKTIWVFSEGDENISSMENGIKYITTAGYNVKGLTQKNTSVVKYMVVTVKGNTVTYEFKPIV